DGALNCVGSEVKIALDTDPVEAHGEGVLARSAKPAVQQLETGRCANVARGKSRVEPALMKKERGLELRAVARDAVQKGHVLDSKRKPVDVRLRWLAIIVRRISPHVFSVTRLALTACQVEGRHLHGTHD